MSTTYINGLTIQTNNKMKKVIAMLALASLMVACGGKGTTEGTTDSTAVAVDTTEVTTVDTTAAEAPVAQPVVE